MRAYSRVEFLVGGPQFLALLLEFLVGGSQFLLLALQLLRLCLEFFGLSLRLFEKFLHFPTALSGIERNRDILGYTIQEGHFGVGEFLERGELDHARQLARLADERGGQVRAEAIHDVVGQHEHDLGVRW